MACSQKPKILYFDGKGRAETARILLAQAGIDFDDERISFDEWQKKKVELDLPYGLPAFELNGVRYFQSLAIVNYIARKHDLYGKNADERLKIDMISQCIHDVASKLPVFEEGDVKEKKLDELFEKTYPPLLKKLETFVPDKGFIVDNKVSLADIAIFRIFEGVSDMRPGSLDKYAKLKRVSEDVAKLPNIAAWLKKRPETKF